MEIPVVSNSTWNIEIEFGVYAVCWLYRLGKNALMKISRSFFPEQALIDLNQNENIFEM